MALDKTLIVERVQEHLGKGEWKAAITDMEKLFVIDRDPLIRVRIGDARLKLNRKRSAIREYLRAAALFAENGFVAKALAQYSLVLRLDSLNTYARNKMEVMETLRPARTATIRSAAPMEYRIPHPFEFECGSRTCAARTVSVAADEEAEERQTFCHLNPAGRPEFHAIEYSRND
jgi:tetratricopeptide (TPR) repeat protein